MNTPWQLIVEPFLCDNSGLDWMKSLYQTYIGCRKPYNIISITQRTENGWELSGDKLRGIVLSKNGVQMCFDIRVETAKGVHVSRDVTWLRRMFFPSRKTEAGEVARQPQISWRCRPTLLQLVTTRWMTVA
jgi:hypothetical protein